MRTRWPLLVLLAAVAAATWIVGIAGRRAGPDPSPDAPEEHGDGVEPTLRGAAPADAASATPPVRRAQDLRQVTLRGRVVDGAGQPLAAATVQAASEVRRTSVQGVDEEGRFTHEVRLWGTMRVRVTAPDHLPWLGPWLGAAGAEDLDLGTITLRPGRALAGHVRFEDGSPAPGILVAAAPEADAEGEDFLALRFALVLPYPTAETDDQGRFRIAPLPEGTYTVMAEWGSWNEGSVEGVQAGRTDLAIRIERPKEPEPPPVPPERIVVDLVTEDGGRVPTCYSAVFSGETRWPGSQDGSRLTLPVPGPGDYTLYVRPDDRGYAPRVLRRLGVRGDPYALALRRAVTLEGEVRQDGRPVVAEVRARGRLLDDGTVDPNVLGPDWQVGEGYWTAKTDDEGRFRLEGLPPGSVQLTVTSPWCRQVGSPLEVATGSRGHLIPMAANPSLALRVHAPDGRDVGTVQVVVERIAPGGLAWEAQDLHFGSEAADDPDPVMTLRVEVSDPDAEYAVTASSESATAEAESPLVRGVRPGEEPTDIHLRARPPLAVLVVDQDGHPVPGALVGLRRLRGGTPALREPFHFGSSPRASPGWPDAGHTGIDGVFRFERRIPPGPWCVLAQTIGTAQAGRLPRVEDAEESVRVVLTRGRRLTGRVVDPEGGSQWGRFVEAWPVDGQQESGLVEDLPHSGRFEFTNLAPGRYVLVSRPNESFHEEEHNRVAVSEAVEAGDGRVELTLHPGLRSTLDLLGPDGARQPPAAVRVVGRYVDRKVVADRDGLFQSIGLPAGRYAFQVVVDGREPLSIGFEAGERVTLRVP